MIEFINDLLFVPKLKTIKFNLWLFGVITIASVFTLNACVRLYGEINLIGNICKGIIYVSLILFILAYIAYVSLKVKEK